MSSDLAPPDATLQLKLRTTDEVLDLDEMQHLVFFRGLRSFPRHGSMVVRRYRAGDIVCTQGDSGNSAFYIVRPSEILALRRFQLERDAQASLEALAKARQNEIAQIESSGGDAECAFVAKAEIRGSQGDKDTYIPCDGPEDINSYTRVAQMRFGDVFGEMSCVTYQPRSATVTATRDCYMIEFLRVIYERLLRNAEFKRAMDATYRERVLKNHLGRLKLFAGLSDAQLNMLSEQCELDSVAPGRIIFRQGDEADAVYIIRNGVVQVAQDLELDLIEDDIRDWQGLCRQLATAAAKKSPPPQAAKEKSPQSAKAQPGAALSVEEMLEKARQGKGKPPAEGKADRSKPAAGDKPAEMSVEEMLQQARQGKGKPPTEDKEDRSKPDRSKPAAGDKPAEMSVEEMLRQARQGKGKPPAEGKPDRSKPAAGDKPAMSVEEMLQQARQGKGQPSAEGGKSSGSKPAAGDKPAAEVEQAGRRAKSEEVPLVRLQGAKADEMLPFIWNCLVADVQQAVKRVAADKAGGSEQDKQLILAALNQLMQQRGFVNSKAAQAARTDSKIEAGTLPVWFAGRRLLDDALQRHLRTLDRFRPLKIRSYLSRGECFGEMGVWQPDPSQSTAGRSGRRNATCIAYDHPDKSGRRKLANVELVRIPKQAIDILVAQSPELQRRLGELVRARSQYNEQAELAPWEGPNAALRSAEFAEHGLSQGQNLLLIDLDKCTRCGDCVTACINSHDDGRSRLYLDGPSFSGYLIPSSCRQCRDPVCMIDCPVTAIVKGDNEQIQIEDWCIGCNSCAKQCPYDSIQMHDLGLVQHYSIGWHYLPRSAVEGDQWTSRRPKDAKRWLTGSSPMFWNIDSFQSLSSRSAVKPWTPDRPAEPICLWHEFETLPRQASGRLNLRVQVKPAPAEKDALPDAMGSPVKVWLNGRPLPQLQRGAGHPLLFEIPQPATADWEAVVAMDEFPLARGVNHIAVEIAYPDFLPVAENQPVFSLRLDALPQVEYDRTAVVCDLCSSLPQAKPACVEMCPHEAAIRVNTIENFPS